MEKYSPFKKDQETSLRIRKYFVSHGGNIDLEIIAKLAFADFSPLEKGEKISGFEIKRRFSEIRKEGYPLKPYSKMKANEAWKYLSEIRADLGKLGFGFKERNN